MPYPNEFRNPFTAPRTCGDGGAAPGRLELDRRAFVQDHHAASRKLQPSWLRRCRAKAVMCRRPKDFLRGIASHLRRARHPARSLTKCSRAWAAPEKCLPSEHYGRASRHRDVSPRESVRVLPIGACVARADLMDWKPGAHASTFGGNPVCIAAALKTIELLEARAPGQNSAEVGAYLKAGLRKTA